MRRLCKPSAKVYLLLFWIPAMDALYGSRLNPVSWSLRPALEKVSLGSTVGLRLHAQIEDGYRLYSLTTPSGGPIKTTVSLESGPDLKGFQIYQPKPDRHRDPNLNVPVETFKKDVDFLLVTELTKDAGVGVKVVTVSVRYQACSDEICLPPITKVATSSITVQKGPAPAKISIPREYQLSTHASH